MKSNFEHLKWLGGGVGRGGEGGKTVIKMMAMFRY